METNRLLQFKTVVETGNLRKAAQLLGISHSGLFKSIKVLEEDLGFALFLPSGRGITVSDEGRQLYHRSARFFEELDQLLKGSETPEASLIRLGSFEVFTTYFVGSLLENYLPESSIEIHELVPGRLEEALLRQRIDIGITYEPIPRPGIEYVEITRIAMAVYTTKNAFKDTPILEIPFAVPVNPLEGLPTHVKGLDAWPENRFKRQSHFKVDLMMSGLDLTRRGKCAIFIPQFVADLHNEGVLPHLRLFPRKLPKGMETVYRNVYLVKRESSAETEVFRKIARALREQCSS